MFILQNGNVTFFIETHSYCFAFALLFRVRENDNDTSELSILYTCIGIRYLYMHADSSSCILWMMCTEEKESRKLSDGKK